MKNELIRRQVLLERLKSGEVNHFTVYLEKIENSIREQLSIHDITTFNRTRLERKLKQIDGLLATIFEEYYESLTPRIADIAEYEATVEVKLLDKNSGPKLEFSKPDLKRLKAMFKNHPMSLRDGTPGVLLEPFIKDWSIKERNRVTGLIRQGYFEGRTTPQIVNSLVGHGKQSDLKRMRRNASTVIRTVIQHISSTARAQVWTDNNDLIEGYVFVATLDGMTTQVCRSLDGQLFKVGKGPLAPLHPSCRSTTRAQLKKEFALLSAHRTRAAKDGPVKGDLNYYDWLKDQSASFQNTAIGPTRAKLLRDGGLSANEFAKLNLGRNFQPLTLDEMREKEPLVFERAGI